MNEKMIPLWKRYGWFYVIQFLSECYFIISIWLYYYLEFVTLEQTIMITLVQSVSTMLCEIPTGAIADLFGRVKSNVYSYGLYVVLLAAMVLFPSFWSFIVIAVVKGFANALASGSFDALCYDTLKEQGDEAAYSRFVSETRSISWLAYFIGSVVGGWMYGFHPSVPYLSIAIAYVGIVVIFTQFIKEPQLVTQSQQTTWRSFWQTNRDGFMTLFSSVRLGAITVLLGSIYFGYYAAAELLGITQYYAYGIVAEHASILFGIGFLLSAGASLLYPAIEKKFRGAFILGGTAFFMILSYVAAPLVPAGIGVFFIMLRIASSTTFRNYSYIVLNKHIPSTYRATALSSYNMLTQAAYIVLSIIAGSSIEKMNPNVFAQQFGLVIASIIALSALGYMFANRQSTIEHRIESRQQ